MPRNIKIITTADSGGLIDMVVVLNKKLNQKGYKSSIIRINKYKNREIRNINKGDYVIFQMSGYGYHNKGLPFWLINQIKLIKKKSSCIGIHFHELNINHKIWDPRFVIMILQKYINIKLLKYCDYWVTSNIQYARWLKKYSLNNKNYICPVHSNTDHDIAKVRKNKRIAVLFGTPGSRVIIYKNYYHTLKTWILKNNLILHDVGLKIEDNFVKNLIKNQSNIKISGKLSTKKIRDLFSKAYFGIFSTPDDLIDKSGILAAYCKYKVCPINLDNFYHNGRRLIKQRFLKFLPDKNKYRSQILKINRINFKLSKKNNINNCIKAYLENYK